MTHAARWACAVIAVMAFAATGRVAHRARAELRAAVNKLATTTGLAAELDQLRLGMRSGAATEVSSAALPDQLLATLAEGGMDAGVMTGFTSTSSATSGGQQAATVVLEPVTLRQFGRFVTSWRRTQPGWLATSIDLAPVGQERATGERPLRVVLVLEATVAEGATP